MPEHINLTVNGVTHELELDPETPLLYVLRNDLGLKSVKYGCGSEQCGACKALVDGQAVPTCKLPVKNVTGDALPAATGGSSQVMEVSMFSRLPFYSGFCGTI